MLNYYGVSEFFTSQHARLIRLAGIANVLERIMRIVIIFIILGGILQLPDKLKEKIVENIQTTSVLDMFLQNPIVTINLLVALAKDILQGIAYWITFKGISLGLYMIVDSNINTREKLLGEDHE